MKSILNKCCEGPKDTLPRLMIGSKTGAIFLIVRIDGRQATGTVVHQGNYRSPVGSYIPIIDTSFLKNYDGSVTLEN